jgi:hypothetical protein
MRFDAITGGSNTSFSIDITSERTINWMPEKNYFPVLGMGNDVHDKNERCSMIRRPGIHLFSTLPQTPVRGMFPGEGRLFAVSGSHLYEVFHDGTYVDRSIPGFSGSSGVGPSGGAVGNDMAPVQMFANGGQLLVVSAGNAYCDSGNGPVPCQFSDQLLDLIIDSTDATGKTLTTLTGNFFNNSDVGRTVQITGGAGFTIQSQVITSVNGTGEALAAASWGVPGSSAGTGIEWLGNIAYTDLTIGTLGFVIGSASRSFSQSDVGLKLIITGGTGFTPGTYTIAGLFLGPTGIPNGQAILDRSAGTPSSTGGIGTEPSQWVTASQGAFLDGYYFAAPSPANKTVYFSAIGDGTSWNLLDFFTKGNYPDNVASLFADHEELYTFGDLQSIQVWRNTGNLDQPFFPDPGAIMHLSCQAPWSVVRLSGGVAWIGGDVSRGERVAFQATGFSPQRVSNPAVESQWAQYTTVADAIAFTLAIQGHELWVISFPTANATWVYDATNQFWAEWGWWNGSSQDRVRFAYHAVVNLYQSAAEQHYVGDWQNGKIYVLSFNYKDDDGTTIYRTRRAPHLTLENKRRMYHRFELDCDVLGTQLVYWNRIGYGRDRIWQIDSNQPSGAGVSLTLSWSDDRGQTFQTLYTQTLDSSVDVSLVNAYLRYSDCAS